MTVKLGVSVGNSPAAQALGYTRSGSSGSPLTIEQNEAYFGPLAGLTDFHYTLNRRCYINSGYGTSFPPTTNGAGGNPVNDALYGRETVASWQNSTNWLSIAQGSVDSQLNQRATEMKNWLQAHPSQVLHWSGQAEPNQPGDITANGPAEDVAAGHWWDMVEHIWGIFMSVGVPRAVITQAGQVLSGGIRLWGPNLTNVNAATTPLYPQPASGRAVLERWYPASRAWIWDNIDGVTMDGYNQGPTWRSFEEIVGGNPSVSGQANRPGFLQWSRDLQASQAARGRVLHSMVWEFGTREVNDPNFVYTGAGSPYWQSLGLPQTKPAWLTHFAQWVEANWTDCYGLTYWDSKVGSTPTDGKAWMIDSSLSAASAWATTVLTNPIFGYTGVIDPPPPPPGEFTPGVISLATRARISAMLHIAAEPETSDAEGSIASDITISQSASAESVLPPPTPIYIAGYETASIGTTGLATAGDNLYQTINTNGGTIIHDTGGRHGRRVRVAKTAATTACRCVRTAGINGEDLIVGVVYFMFDTLPSANVQAFSLKGNGSVDLNFRVNGTTLNAQWSAGTAQNGATIAAGTWYRLEFIADISGTTYTADWSVATGDGVATDYTTVTLPGQTADTFLGWQWGTNVTTSVTYDISGDDVMLSATDTDYPIGPIKVLYTVPNADGTHNLNGHISTQAGGTTFLWQQVDDWLSNGTNDGDSTYIRQTATGSGDYAEIAFTDTSETLVIGVTGLATAHSGGTAANDGECRIRDSHGTETVIYNGDISELVANMTVKSKLLTVPGGGWTQAEFNALVLRWGYSTDVIDEPRLTAAMLQYAVTI